MVVKQGKRAAWTEWLSCNVRRGQNGCPVTIPRAYKAPILVWNVNLLESNKNVRAISCYHQSWKQAACKAKNKNNPDKACGTPTQVTQDRTPAHRHTHTHTLTRRIHRTNHCLQFFFSRFGPVEFCLVGFHPRFCKCVLRSFPWLDTLNYSSGPSDFARWCVWLTLRKGKHTFCKTALFSVFWANSSVSQKYNPFSKYTTLNYDICI